MEEVELDNLDQRNHEREEEEHDEDEDEDEDFPLPPINVVLDWSKYIDEHNTNEKDINKILGGRALTYRNFIDLFKKLSLEEDVYNPRFVKYLIDRQKFSIKTISPAGSIVNDYDFSYYGKEYTNEDGVKVRPFYRFKTNNGVIEDPSVTDIIVSDIRHHYDDWKRYEINKRLKQAGIISGVALVIVGLVTGLTLGLRRGGKDLKRDSKERKHKESKIKPDGGIIPWIEDLSGGTLIAVGNHLFLIIGAGTVIYLLEKK